MRIAIVSPLYESVPPKLYGGTERVVSYLTEELVRSGHDVTLFATGDSVTGARLRPMALKGLRLDTECRDPLAHHVAMLHDVLESASEFDVIHFHLDYLHYPSVRQLRLKALTTLHGRLDLPDLAPLYRRYDELPLVSISQAQREPLPWVNWVGTVHHGLPEDLLRVGDGGGGYLAFLGRISPEKRPDRAIRIARQVGMPLRMAAKIERGDQGYFEAVVEPLLGPDVEFIGEIPDRDKGEFLGNARALLFPIDWPEPFGLVMIEAMACGTPVIACPCGSVPEIVDHGVSGFIAPDEDAAARAVAQLDDFDRLACRRRFEQRFSAARMARDYVCLYKRIAARDDDRPLIRSAA
ncbi:MAG TPA: glycosyltransferase family 4 protein [Burkholderiales bacterium]|nr:glycosyltransferase family 4 protein [Burkholderiales bacterium]